jgi:uncharacterized protein
MSRHLRRLSGDAALLLSNLAQRGSTFAALSGLRCRTGCGDCCRNPHIECTTLELLPVAFLLHDEGTAEATLDSLDLAAPGDGCLFLERKGFAHDGKQLGRCSRYAHRPSVCILFGASARRSGDGKLESVACRVMKEDDPGRVASANEFLAQGATGETVLATEASLALMGLHPILGAHPVPFHEALRAALETVLVSSSYAAEANL